MKTMCHSQKALSRQSNQILKQSSCSCILCKKLSLYYDSASGRPQFSYNRQWYAKCVQIHWSYTNVCWIRNVCNLLRNFAFIFLNEINLYFLFSDLKKIPVYHAFKKFNGLYLLFEMFKEQTLTLFILGTHFWLFRSCDFFKSNFSNLLSYMVFSCTF